MTGNAWTDDDREECIEALLRSWHLPEWHGTVDPAEVAHEDVLVVLAAFAPRVDARVQRAYEEGIQRGGRTVADPARFPIRNPDYTMRTGWSHEPLPDRSTRHD